MTVSSVRAFRATAMLGFVGVALGAFGAHGLQDVFLHRPEARTLWEKAVLYQFVHTVVMLVLTFLEPFPLAAWILFSAGILLFSGSLYLLAFTGLRWFGIVTPPLGGLMFLAGWLTLALARQARPRL